MTETTPEPKTADFTANVIPLYGSRSLEPHTPGPAGLKGGDGGGTFDGMPPDFPERVATLEANVKNMTESVKRIDDTVARLRDRIDTDFRITWGGLIFVALGLASLMAKGFHWI
jgi:hypothetical protein